jgi:hypothetical protein
VLGLDLDDNESIGGREPVLAAKLMDDDADVIVSQPFSRSFSLDTCVLIFTPYFLLDLHITSSIIAAHGFTHFANHPHMFRRAVSPALCHASTPI